MGVKGAGIVNDVCGNLVPCPQEYVAKDFLEQFWNIENVIKRRGDVIMTLKLIFSRPKHKYGSLNPLMFFLVLIWYPISKEKMLRTYWNNFEEYKMLSVWGVTLKIAIFGHL